MAIIVKIDISTAFDRVNHREFSMSSALWIVMFCVVTVSQFHNPHHVIVDVVGVNWLTLCQDCPLLFLLCISELFSIPENDR